MLGGEARFCCRRRMCYAIHLHDGGGGLIRKYPCHVRRHIFLSHSPSPASPSISFVLFFCLTLFSLSVSPTPTPPTPPNPKAHSLYVRAAATGLERGSALLPAHPLTLPTSTSATTIARRDAEIALLVTAARAHIAMGGVLDGLALIDEAAGIRGGGGGGSGGRWGGDGEAGAGTVRLGDQDASALASELCVTGGRVGLRAALRLRERLADEVRGHGQVASQSAVTISSVASSSSAALPSIAPLPLFLSSVAPLLS